MHRRGSGYQSTAEDHERRRRLDAISLVRCQRHNKLRRIQGIWIASARAAAPQPPPPPPPPPLQADDRRPMMVEEAEQLVRDYLPLPADRSLPDGWLVNLDNVPVAPPLTGQARLEYIQSMWQADVTGVVTEEERSHVPPFNAEAPYWDVIVRSEQACRLHSFATTSRTNDEPPEPAPVESSDDEEAAPPPTCAGH